MKRRKFVSHSAMAATSLMFLRCKAEKAQKAIEEATGEKLTEFGIQLWSVRHLMAEDPAGTLKQIADIGYTDVEMMGDGYTPDSKFFGYSTKDFKSLCDDLGLGLKTAHTMHTGRVNQDLEVCLIRNWERYCNDTAELGMKALILAYLDNGERETMDHYKELIDILNTSAEMAKSYGLEMCYHNHDFEFFELDGIIPYDYMLENLDPNMVNFEMDHYWVAKANVNSIDYFKKYPGRFHYWHVKDMADTEDRFFAPVGKGIIDYKEIFQHAELSGLKHFHVEQDDFRDYEAMVALDMSHDYLTDMDI